MTVSSTTTRKSANGNGSDDEFPYDFKIFDDDDITVIIRTDSTGAETVKTKTTHYTVSGVGSATGGNVTFTSGNIPASGETVVLLRTTARTQLTDYVANDPFPAESHEDALDKLTFITQELEEQLGRSLKVSQTNVIATSEFTADATARANKILGFDGSGDLVVTEGKVDTITSSVSSVSAGGTPTASATYTASSGALALAFGLVTGNTGATGSTGSTGAAGSNAGLALTFSTSTSDADPGGGKLAFNNGTISSADTIFIDDNDDNGVDISTFVQSWDDVSNSTARGIILITKEGTASTYAMFKVSGAVTNASGYSKVTVTHVVSNGTFSNTDGITVQFSYSGQDGAGSLSNVVEDTSPQLGGDLDLNSNDITGTGNITATGVVTGQTLEATADTSAGDNAAIGYTAAEGLVLTGQGSTSDITIKNDADATVASIATGTTIFTLNDDVGVSGRAVGHVTTDNDGSFDLAVGNDFKCTTAGGLTLTFTNPAAGQSGNIMFINGGNHTIAAHASVAINADVLTAISATGTYHLAYYCSAASGNNTILVSGSAILT